jgi:hypothetical protein
MMATRAMRAMNTHIDAQPKTVATYRTANQMDTPAHVAMWSCMR